MDGQKETVTESDLELGDLDIQTIGKDEQVDLSSL